MNFQMIISWILDFPLSFLFFFEVIYEFGAFALQSMKDIETFGASKITLLSCSFLFIPAWGQYN